MLLAENHFHVVFVENGKQYYLAKGISKVKAKIKFDKWAALCNNGNAPYDEILLLHDKKIINSRKTKK